MKTSAFSTFLKRVFLSAIAASSLFNASQVFGQVNGAGPSDPNLFDTVLNFPTDGDLGTSQSFGRVTEATIPINLSDGGTIATEFRIAGAEANISGGFFEGSISVFGGGVPLPGRTNISGGVFNLFSYSSSPFSGSPIAEISGGDFRGSFDVSVSDSGPANELRLLGGEFKVNGASFNGTDVNLFDGDVLTGTLQDGSAFIFSNRTDDTIKGLLLISVPWGIH